METLKRGLYQAGVLLEWEDHFIIQVICAAGLGFVLGLAFF